MFTMGHTLTQLVKCKVGHSTFHVFVEGCTLLIRNLSLYQVICETGYYCKYGIKVSSQIIDGSDIEHRYIAFLTGNIPDYLLTVLLSCGNIWGEDGSNCCE